MAGERPVDGSGDDLEECRKTMMPMKRSVTVLFVVLGLLATSGVATSQAADPATLIRIATLAPEGTTWMKVMRQVDQDVRRETGGAVGFKIYPGGVQGDEPVVMRKIRSKQLQGGAFTGATLGAIASEVRVLELPFLSRRYEQVDAIREKIGPELEAALEKGGYVTLGWVDVGFIYLFSRQPIATQADMKSAKMWLAEGDPLAEAFFKAAGVSPVPLAVTDVMTSLQTGMVDGVYSSMLACLALQWNTRVRNYTDLPVTYATGAVLITREAWEGIPAQHRETVRRIARERFRELVLRTRQEEVEARAQIEKSGVSRVAVTPAEVQRFETVGRGVWQQLAGKLYPKALLDDAVAAAGAAGAPGASGAAAGSR